jgi:AP-1 complex subunit beta-1
MYMDRITNPETLNSICRKLAPPLVTLAGATQPEVQYVALRNINLIVQRRPNLLSPKVKVFFCKYNDPIYVKMEKLDILVKLVNDKNVEGVLLELKEYATEVDVEYVRRAVRTIGRCAIKLEVAAERCIKVLLQLIQTKVNYVVQEAIVVIKDIFRRYPNRYEAIIGVLCSSLETLDEPEAKASMIWIIGEYADRIDNAGELLQGFLDSFHEETTPVQLQMLTAAVKLFLKKPAESEALVQTVLSSATEKSDNPDLRDRGYIYWRLLSTDPDAAKAVILADRPVIADDTTILEATLLDTLTRNLATLASVYHKPAEAFVRRARLTYEDEEEEDEEIDVYADDEVTGGGAGSGGGGGGGGGGGMSAGGSEDLLGLGGGGGGASAAVNGGGLDDFFGAPAPSRGGGGVPNLPVCGEKDGLELRAGLSVKGGAPSLELVVTQKAPGAPPVTGCMIKFQVNVLGAAPAAAAVTFAPIAAGASGAASVPLTLQPALFAAAPADPAVIQAALKDNASGRVVFFAIPIAVGFAAGFTPFAAVPAVDRNEFILSWRALAAEHEAAEVARDVPSADANAVQARLGRANVAFVAARPGPDPSISMSYFSAQLPCVRGVRGASRGNDLRIALSLTPRSAAHVLSPSRSATEMPSSWRRHSSRAFKLLSSQPRRQRALPSRDSQSRP